MIINCKPTQDDKIILENPHKGWYYHYVDNGFSDPRYRDDISPESYKINMPGIHHLYIRFDWCDIEKENGKFDWSPIDKIMEQFPSYKFAFRFCTFEAYRIKYATPKWVYDAGATGYISKTDIKNGKIYSNYNKEKRCIETATVDTQVVAPDYSDPIFLKYLERFMGEYGKKYDGDSRVEFIDIGTFGTWGEGHNAFGANITYTYDTIKKHIDLHVKYFKKTQIVINDDMIHYLHKYPNIEKAILDFCEEHNIGLRDDSIYVNSYCRNYGFSSIRSPEYFDRLSKVGPVDLEMTHYFMAKKDGLSARDMTFDGGFRFLTAMKECHTSFAGFHGHAGEWYSENKDFHDYCANRLGYWYFIDKINLNDKFADITVTNKGFSKSYFIFDLKLILENDKGSYIINTESTDNRLWEGESTTEFSIPVSFNEVPAGNYKLKIGLFERGTPIKLGFKDDVNSTDGTYIVADNFKIKAVF